MKRVFLLFLTFTLLFFSISHAENDASIILKDASDRTISLTEAAQRVVSCYYISTSAMLSLGLKDHLIGIEKKAELRPIYQLTDTALLSLPQIGSMKEINVEAIAALKPDLVILPLKCSSYVDSFEAVQIPVLVVNPEDEIGLRQMILLLGTACDVPERADKLLSWFDSVWNSPVVSDGQTALFLSNSSFRKLAPEGMYQSRILRLAGFDNAASILKESYWTEISLETMLAWNADVMVLPSDAVYSAEDQKSAFEEAGLPLPKAIQENRIYQMPDCLEAWDSPVPSSILGIEWLRAKHGLRSMEEVRQEVRLFYETFYGFTPNEELLDEIR